VPKSNRKEIIREKKQVPSFVELSDEINRLRIYEYLNPKISESQKVSGASAIKSNVDVKQEQILGKDQFVIRDYLVFRKRKYTFQILNVKH
jgi:hypothetical protein